MIGDVGGGRGQDPVRVHWGGFAVTTESFRVRGPSLSSLKGPSVRFSDPKTPRRGSGRGPSPR